MKSFLRSRKAIATGIALLISIGGFFLIRSLNTALNPLPLLATTKPIGYLPGDFLVSQAGSPQYSVSIEVPQGTNGVQPNLEIIYANSESNGLIGYGWQLQGLTTITRTGKIIPTDSIKGGVQLNDEDRFAINGQRLIAYKDKNGKLLTTIAAQNAAYGEDGTEYRTEIESWTKVISQGNVGGGPSSFTAYSRDGSVMYFATTNDARVQPVNCKVVSTWALNKVVDRNGNYISIEYDQNKEAGCYMPSKIAYTGNEAGNQSPQRLLKFNYESRRDTLINYIAGIKFSCAKRLNSIQTFIDLDGNGSAIDTPENLVKSYKIDYQYSPSTKRSIIQSLSVCDTKGTCLPATKFKWTVSDTTRFFADSLMKLPDGFAKVLAKDVEKVRGDFDGNGKMDIALLERNASKMPILFANNNGQFELREAIIPAGYSNYFNNPLVEAIAADYNADGLTDLFFFESTAASVPILTPNLQGGFTGVKVNLPSGFNQTFNLEAVTKIAGDVNGDGRADFMGFRSGYKSSPILLSVPNGFSGVLAPLPAQVSGVFNTTTVLEYQGADFNGDGLTDVASFINQAMSLPIIYSNGKGGFTSTLEKLPTKVAQYTNLTTTKRILGDFNADGIADLSVFIQDATSIPILYSNGAGAFEYHSIPASKDIAYFTQKTTEKVTGDINGDHITDIIGFSTGLKSAPALISGYNGKYTYKVIPLSDDVARSINDVNAQRLIGDFNGDGLLDISAIKQGFTTMPVLFANRFNVENNVPDLITRITNGIGNVISVNYMPITNSAIYLGPVSVQYPLMSNQFASYVVKQYSSASAEINPTSVLSYSMQYKGAVVDQFRGFLGFQSVQTTDHQRKVLIEDNYLVTFPYNGVRSSKVIRNLDQSGALMSQEFYNYQTAQSTPNGSYTMWNSSYRMRHFTNGYYNYTLVKKFSYDATHENLVLIMDLGDSLKSDDDLFTYFRYNTEDSNWWKRNFPIAEKAKKDSASVDWNKWSASDFYWKKFDYDTRMNMTYNASYMNDAGNGTSTWCPENMKYDSYGNIVEKRYPPNLSADSILLKTQFDPVYHTYPITITSAVPRPDKQGSLPLVTQLQFDPRFNVKIKETDPNNHLIFSIPDYGMDGFGRVLITQTIDPITNDQVTTTVTDYSGSANGYNVQTQIPISWNKTIIPDSSWLFTKEHFDGFERTITTRKNGKDSAHDWYQATQYRYDGELAYQYMPQFLSNPTAINDSINGYYLQEYSSHGNLKSVHVNMSDTSNKLILVNENISDPTDNRIVYVKTPSPVDNASVIYYRKQYDSRGRMIENSGPYTEPLITKKGENFGLVTYYYDALDRLYKVVDPLGEINTYTYNSVNEIIEEYSPETGSLKSVYNNNIWKIKQIGPKGTLQWVYDDLARPILKTAIDNTGKIEPIGKYIYDSDSLVTNGKGNLSYAITPNITYAYSYNNQGGIATKITTVKALGTSFAQTFTYNPSNQEVSSLLPDSSRVNYSYNYSGNLSQIELNSKELASYKQYNPQGMAEQIAYENGVHSNYNYDALGRLTSSKTEKGAYVHQYLSYNWNYSNKITRIKDNLPQNDTDDNAAYDYLQSGRLVHATSASGIETYAYDAAGNRLQINDLKYTYYTEKKHQIESISRNNVILNEFDYDTAGEQTKKSVALDSLSGLNNAALNFNYTYDVQGNMTSVYEVGSGNDRILVNKMVYNDDQERIIKYDKDSTITYYISDNYEVTRLANGQFLHTEYIMDDDGIVYAHTTKAEDRKLIKEKDAGKLGMQSTINDTPSSGGWGYGMILFSSLLCLVACWILQRIFQRLFRGNESKEQSYLHLLRTTSFLVAGSLLLTQNALAADQTTEIIHPGSNGPGVPVAGEKRFFHQNQIGSSVMLTDQTGGLTNTIAYKPFGELDKELSTGSDDFRYKFTGKELDYYSGLQYFGSRYYDGNIGRFIAPDPAKQYYSPYVYGDDDPLQGMDPDGELFFEIALIISAIVFAYAGASLANGTIDPTEWQWDSAKTWVGIVAGAITGVAVVATGGAALAAFGLVTAESVTLAGVSASTLAFTAADAAFLVVDTYTFAEDPSAVNGIFVGLDLIPFAGAILGRMSKGAKLLNAERAVNAESKIAQDAKRLNSVMEFCPLSFLEGTLVDQQNDQVAIQDLQVGDLVMGYDETTGEEGLFAVSKLYRRVATGFMILVIGGTDTIQVTPEHEFFKEKTGWTEAQFLHVGDRIISEQQDQLSASTKQTHTNLSQPVTSVKMIFDKEVVVYNLEIEQAHNYFVGKSKILSHNGCGKSKRLRALGRTPGKNTRSGREVFDRMRSNGLAVTINKKKFVYVVVVKGGPRVRKPLDSNIHMGHILDAVDVWNNGSAKYFGGKPLYTFGAKSKQARQFMLDSKNYEFEWGPLNSSNGASLGQTYVPPTGHTGTW